MKKKVKIYIVKEFGNYSYTIGIYSKLSNAKRKIKSLKESNKNQFVYFDYSEREIEDMYEKET